MPLSQTFKAMVVSETAEKTLVREIRERALSDLPAGQLIIDVKYSSLNYKDALSATGNRGVTKKYPHTPGIDAAGLVADSTTKSFGVGDPVIVMGFDFGMNTAGGFGQYISVPSGWAIKLPQGLSLKESMSHGTAGLTAALCIIRLMASGLSKDSGADAFQTKSVSLRRLIRCIGRLSPDRLDEIATAIKICVGAP